MVFSLGMLDKHLKIILIQDLNHFIRWFLFLTVIREFFGPSTSVNSEKGANLKWYGPISEEICHAEQKYMPFFGPSVISEKKSKAQKHIQNDSMLRFGFFPQNTLGDGPAFCFFSKIHRYGLKSIFVSISILVYIMISLICKTRWFSKHDIFSAAHVFQHNILGHQTCHGFKITESYIAKYI